MAGGFATPKHCRVQARRAGPIGHHVIRPPLWRRHGLPARGPVSRRHRSYNGKGREVLYNDLMPADVILLMEEMDAAF
jgi:hypothetical protein